MEARAARARKGRERRTHALLLATATWSSSILAVGCRQDMHDQPRYKPFAKSAFFADDRSARPLVADTVARGQLREDEHLYTGKLGGVPATTFPFPVTAEVLERGRQRFDIYCTPCHGPLGRGDGMIVQRGFKRPPSLHIALLRQAAPGYLFDVITNGFGAMADYSAQVPVEDRWAIVAYIRALQISQHAALDDVPAAKRGQLERGAAAERE